jgi:hypothetical protein
VRAVYLFGSTEMGSAGAGSDIDLLVAFEGDAGQERDLRHWLEGWSLCLAEVGLQLYGLPSRGLLDARFVSPARAEAEARAALSGGRILRALPLGRDADPPLE